MGPPCFIGFAGSPAHGRVSNHRIVTPRLPPPSSRLDAQTCEVTTTARASAAGLDIALAHPASVCVLARLKAEGSNEELDDRTSAIHGHGCAHRAHRRRGHPRVVGRAF